MMAQKCGALVGLAGMLVAFAGAARADSCARSSQYILENLTGDQARQPRVYQTLSRVCEETLLMPNVKDAFILMTGAIAVIPKRDAIGATASTLAEFCTRFPRETLRFVARKELSLTKNLGRAVRLDSSAATSCQKIVQGG